MRDVGDNSDTIFAKRYLAFMTQPLQCLHVEIMLTSVVRGGREQSNSKMLKVSETLQRP